MNLKQTALLVGPLGFVLVLLSPVPDNMSPAAMKVAATALLMVIWWVTEAIPIPATALIPLVTFPLLGVLDTTRVAHSYAEPPVFLFLGGFLLALAMEKWGLHRRIALLTLGLFGTSKRSLVLGFMVASAFLSMWISNTATTMMMLPIVSAVLARFDQDKDAANFSVALLLGVAYAASVGGIGTLIGTPPNIVLVGQLEQLFPGQNQLDFGRWMLMALPLVLVMVPAIWFYLVRLAAPVSADKGKQKVDFKAEAQSLGPMNRGEKIVLTVFLLTAMAWILRRPVLAEWLPALNDTHIAIAAALVLFAIPVDWQRRHFAMDWQQAQRLPWGVLLLFGGGFALAGGMESSGLTAWMSGQLLFLEGWPLPVIVFATTVLMIVLTELTSNTATTITMLPVLASVAAALDVPPLLLMIPATMAASCAFMLPAATPPNAIVFGTGRVSLAKMFRTGLWLNVIAALLISILACTLVPALIEGLSP